MFDRNWCSQCLLEEKELAIGETSITKVCCLLEQFCRFILPMYSDGYTYMIDLILQRKLN